MIHTCNRHRVISARNETENTVIYRVYCITNNGSDEYTGVYISNQICHSCGNLLNVGSDSEGVSH